MPSTNDPGAERLRELARAHRRAADRLVILRLQMARALADTDEGAGRSAALGLLRSAWADEHYPAVAEISARLRAASDSLAAAAREKSLGGRVPMGGRESAAYLGSGADAAGSVGRVHAALSADRGRGRLSPRADCAALPSVWSPRRSPAAPTPDPED